jgi:hypothetical protein
MNAEFRGVDLALVLIVERTSAPAVAAEALKELDVDETTLTDPPNASGTEPHHHGEAL